MSIQTVDLMDNNKVIVSFDDGTSVVYDEAQLRSLKPLETIKEKPGVGPRSEIPG
jgi:hypothetical protein